MCRWPWFEIEHQKVSKAWPPHQAKFNDLIRFQNFQLVVASQNAAKCTANTFAIFALISELTESLSFGPNSKPSKATRACHTAQDAVCTGTWSWAYKEDKIRIKFWLLVMLPICIVYLACCWVIMSWYSKKATPTSSSMISNSTEPSDLQFQVSEQLSNTFNLAIVFHCLSKYQPHWGASWFAFLILLERIKLQLPKSDQQLFDSLLLTSAIGSTASKCTELSTWLMSFGRCHWCHSPSWKLGLLHLQRLEYSKDTWKQLHLDCQGQQSFLSSGRAAQKWYEHGKCSWV